MSFPAALFPNLLTLYYRVTSQATPRCNCIAWAAGDWNRNWWPTHAPLWYWPPGAPYEDTVAAFVQAYGTLGYVPCPDGSAEAGFEKVVLYGLGGAVKHAARQLPNGRWSSKMGAAEDIEHVLQAVEGPCYGTAVQFLKRPVGGVQLPPPAAGQPPAAPAGPVGPSSSSATKPVDPTTPKP